MSVCVCKCVRVCLCVCKVMRERKGGGKGGGANAGARWSKYSDWLSGDHFEPPPPPPSPSISPLDHHPPLPRGRPRMVAGVRFQVPSGDTLLSNFDSELEKASTEAL